MTGTLKSVRSYVKFCSTAFRKYKAFVTKWFLWLPGLIIRKRSRVIPGKVAMMTISHTYSCNPKYIYEEMKRRCPTLDIVWVVASPKKKVDFPKGVRVVHLRSIECLKEVYSSAIWLDNGVMFSTYFKKLPQQIHIQTMHGSLGIKRIDNGVLSRMRSGAAGRRIVWRESTLTDFVVTNSAFEEGVFRRVFWKNTPMVRLGHARTDPLFHCDARIVEKVKKELNENYGIPLDRHLVLYAPTHRKGLVADDIDFDFLRFLEALKRKFGGEWTLLIRFHCRTKSIKANVVGDSVVDVTSFPDMQELMLVADMGVTDYSSWIFDYLVTGRPAFIFAPDFERYTSVTALCYPLEETPFPVAYDVESLYANINAFDAATYSHKRKLFLDAKECVDDGHSAERVVDWMETLPQYAKSY